MIKSQPDPPGISKAGWIDMIREHPNLVSPTPCERINPFTKRLATFPVRPDTAHVVINGQQVGMMDWSQSDESEINVFGSPSVVAPIATDIANRLAARFEAR